MTGQSGFAVVGYAVRFPGAADAREFWDVLAEGRDAVSEVPADRWDVDEFFDADPDAAGKMVSRRAGFVDDVAGFDAPFFGVSAREAMFMDPQHRLVLETAWSAVEHAGIAPEALAGTRTGVFLGLSTHEFLGMLIAHTGYEDVDIYSGTGTSPAAAAGRVSFRMGLQGPAVAVDTACSSSLVAVHQACQALRDGDCDTALVGGVNVILTPVPMINLTRARMLAPDGRCKTFDAAADGYVRGEGCGVVVLKRTGDALRDGDRIRAVIRGSAVNQDGASGGLTVPNGVAQQHVIADALRRAGLGGGEVDYLEAHGTGTSLGDPIEVQAAAAAFGDGRDPDRPLLIGSVKTNIGHLEAASGIAGLIKVVLSLEHETLPVHLHLRRPSPHIPWERLPVRVVAEATPWQRNDRPRIAGVSSFGFSGTNAHVLLEEAPVASPTEEPDEAPHRRYHLLPLSARTPEALVRLASRHLAYLEDDPDATIVDICAAAGAGRSHFEHRAALVVDSRPRARRLLRAIHEERPAPGLVRGVCSDRPKTAWLFGGQGNQFPGMAREVFDHEPVFAQTLRRCGEVLDGLLPRPLLEVIFDTGPEAEHNLRNTAFAQPALFAVEMGMARLWRSWGVEPDVVLGHSVGQYAAACVAGVFGLDEGARLIAERGRLFANLPSGGRMLAVFADPDRVERCTAEHSRLSVAAYNGANTVLSGPAPDLEQVHAELTAAGSRCDWLDTSHAFHSALVDPALDEFESFAAQFEYRAPKLTLVCNRTGKVLTRQTRLDAPYWRRHAREPVRFADSAATLADLGCAVLMELGPQPVLIAAALRNWPETAPVPTAIASLRRDADAHRCFTDALGVAYTTGHRLDFAGHLGRRRTLDLPTYPFEHRAYWFPTTKVHTLPAGGGVESPAAESNTGDWLTGMSDEQRIDRIIELTRTELGNALRVAPAEIDPTAEFMTIGMDSMIAMELRGRLQAALGTPVPASLFFENPTVSTLAEALHALWLDASSDPSRRESPIPRVPHGCTLPCDVPLSHAQEQLWFLNQLLPSSSAYNVAIRVDIRGALDHEVLQRSLEAVVDRHEALRTVFQSRHGAPQAILTPSQPIKLAFEEIGDEADIAAAAVREASVPFDIGAGPLLRARLFGVGDQRHVLVVTMHHIVTDGWSFRVLLGDLGRTYQALERGAPAPLDDLPIQYADYARWQREQLTGPEFDAHIEFWKADLAGAPPLELDTDRPRPKSPTFRGARIRFDLGRERADALRDLCRAGNVTLSVPLLAAFATVLQRYSGQHDLVIGTLTANRGRLETENLIGLFVNALPIRIRLDGDPDMTELIDRIRGRMSEVLAHQDVPFDLIVTATAPDRDASRNPLFGVQLVVQPAAGAAELSSLGLDVAEIDTHTAKRDLTLTFFDDELLAGHVEYATELFDEARIERLIAHFREVVDALVSDRRLRLSEVTMLTESERAHYAVTRSPLAPTARSVPELFEMTADRTPDAVAVRAPDRSLTYRELDAAANRLARRLRALGVGAGAAVGLRVGRSAAMAVGMLGILKAGGVYVPVDPTYPQDRIEHMLGEAGVALLLDERDVDGAEAGLCSAERLENLAAADDLAYIMYTSGSTGRPKGVAVTHGSVVEYAETLGRELGITGEDVYLETASISFSSSIRQMLVPFAVGAEVVIATTEERRDPAALLRRIGESAVTVADLVPTVVRRVIDVVAAADAGQRTASRRNRLRLLLTASEPLRAGVVRAWREQLGGGASWINMYGQTETTGIVSLHPVGEPDGDAQSIVPIGRPRANVGMYVLDRLMRPVPPGVGGALFIAGPALAREYVGDPTLTAQKYVPAPWNPAERLYVSGDMVRLGWDGTIEYRGRADRQVKIRGLRVEPAEIDRVLLEHPGVREAVTVVREANADGAALVAYFTTGDTPVPVGELRAHARRQLPDHMVPSAFTALEQLPLTPNGKLDRTALPEVTITRDQEIEYVPPRSGVEQSLAEIWSDTLQLEQIGAGDNFFELGGHSLLAAQVRSRIHQLLGVELPLEALFEDQTLSDLAHRIEGDTGVDTSEAPLLRPVARTGPPPLSYAQELMWRNECDDPGSPAHWIDVSIRITGPLDPDLVVRGIQAATHRHELLRTVFRPSGASAAQVILDSYTPEVPIFDGAAALQHDVWPDQPDLATCPPLRAELCRIDDGNHILRLRVHRILADGYTMRLLLSEIGGLVASSAGLPDFPLLDGDLHYADYAIWERSWLTGAALQRRIDHFRREFAVGELPPALPTDHPRTGRSRRAAGQLDFEFPAEVAAAARALAVREHASLYTVLLAGFAAALGGYAGRRTVVLGSPVTRRNDPVTQLMLGPFMNTVPLRIDLPEGGGLAAMVQNMKTTVLGALSHQDAPSQHVIAALAAEHGPSAAAIGETVFLMDDPVPGEFAAGGFRLTRVPPERVIARRELTAAMSTRNRQITGTLTYDSTLFDHPSIECIVAGFIGAVSALHVDCA
ncbi:amino acid adenylation domain [Mycolicibacterium vanbaalenii PYR-1]|uniref:Amino acid adenylation domain n=2 Tax=Mycolicibacterium vanbaalenii TaxID=110539 RepID=A1T3T8_MYCVP|nr:amino acid adenylation domain [Mycolicibacterium vanbaalenii PYR-1]